MAKSGIDTGYFGALSAAQKAGETYAANQAAAADQAAKDAAAASAASAATEQQKKADAAGNTTYNYDTDPETMRMRENNAFAAAQNQATTDRERQNATTVMKDLLTSYGLTSLYDRVVGFVQQGYDQSAISVLIRTTPEYKTRFPAMEALAAKGRAISEGEYINYETTAAGLERRYGMPQGMLSGNITKLLTNEVSATELNDRVLLASSASLQAPQELKDQFKNFYGIDSGGMAAYFLDPDVATPLLEKQYASAVIGQEATRQGVGIDVYGAENLQGLGVTQTQARAGFGTVAASQGLTTGAGDVTTQQELIAGTLGQDAAAQKNIERAAGGRVGRFQQGGEFATTAAGAVGLGSAATQ